MTYIYCEMITTISLANIHHLIWIQKNEKNTFFSLWGLRINCQQFTCVSCNSVKLTMIKMIYFTPIVLIYLITGSLYMWQLSLSPSILPALLLVTRNLIFFPLSFFLFVFKDSTYKRAHKVYCLSLSDRFHLAQPPQGYFLSQMAGFPPFMAE